MSLSLEQVDRIARLAHIELTPATREATQAKLNGIFGLIEEMQAVDTTGVAPMSHPQDLVQRLRPDAVIEACKQGAVPEWGK